METLKIDCMAETVNGQSYESYTHTNKNVVTKKEVYAAPHGSLSNANSSLTAVTMNGTTWAINQNLASQTLDIVAEYTSFTSSFDNMVKDILGEDEAIRHSQEYIAALPNKIVRQFCKELCHILLDEYGKGPAASWDSGSSHVVTAIASSSGHTIQGIKVYDPWHTIARMSDIGVITAEDLGVSEEEFNEHISWYKVKGKK